MKEPPVLERNWKTTLGPRLQANQLQSQTEAELPCVEMNTYLGVLCWFLREYLSLDTCLLIFLRGLTRKYSTCFSCHTQWIHLPVIGNQGLACHPVNTRPIAEVPTLRVFAEVNVVYFPLLVYWEYIYIYTYLYLYHCCFVFHNFVFVVLPPPPKRRKAEVPSAIHGEVGLETRAALGASLWLCCRSLGVQAACKPRAWHPAGAWGHFGRRRGSDLMSPCWLCWEPMTAHMFSFVVGALSTWV